MVILKKCEPELLYILAELFNFSEWNWRNLVFLTVGRSHLWSLKAAALLVSKIYWKLVNERDIDHLEKCALLSDSQHDLRSSQSTPDLLAVVSDRIGRASSRCNTWYIHLMLLAGFIMLVFFTKWSLMEFLFRYLALVCLFLVIDSFKWF